MIPTAALAGAATPAAGHFVRFYEEDDFLLSEVASFIERGLAAGGAGVVIASAEHRAQIASRLRVNGLGVAADLTGAGRLVLLDAADTLAEFSVDGWPDREGFQRVVGRVIVEAASAGGPVHAFGEMVALLGAEGRFDAAIHLERLWNELAQQHRFELFCAYPSRLFASADRVRAFQQVCGAHDHVCLSEHVARASAPADLHRLLASWEQKAAAMEAEVARRREAESALRQRERELTDFVENAAEGLHRIAGDGTILWANRAELEMLGYTYDEYVGRHIAEFHVDPIVIRSILDALAAGETLRDHPARLRRKDGGTKHVLINSNACFENGKLLYSRCFTRDATDRLERQRAQDQLRDTLMHAPVAAALLVGPAHTFRFANQRFGDMVGRHDLAGKEFAAALPEWNRDGITQHLDEVLRSGAAYCADECRVELLVAGRREERFVRLSLEPLRTLDGLVEGVIAVAVDLTERVRDRRKIERSLAEREQLLARLEEASRAKDEFLAMLGHELRNPLSPIVTALQLMRMRGETGTGREQAIIQRQLDHLVRLVDDLLDISKVTRGKIELRKDWIAIADVLTKAVEMSSPLLERRSHRLQVEAQPGLRVHGDPVRLAQVVANLLTNAARYTEVGGDIHLSAAVEAGEMVIRVKDNGIGIASAMLPKVFDIFFQGLRGGRSDGGLGIGLALVKSFVSLHGGSVGAYSDGPGRGSEFVVRLPTVVRGPDTDGDRPPPSAVPLEPAALRLRVLIVDDNVDAAETLAHLLGALGHEVKVFNDPAAALVQANAFQPELAILDIGMPVMDGYELAARLRAQPELQGCRFVALTGYGQDGDRMRSHAAGFSAHFVKPLQHERLLEFIGCGATGRTDDGSLSCEARRA